MKSAIEILKNDLNHALIFLKKKYRHFVFSKFFRKNNASQWFIIMGASGVGKTSLLLNNGLSLVDIHDQEVLLAYPTQHCHWLFSNEAVFLDMTGRYGSDVWKGWLKQLSLVHGKPPIQGLLIAFDLKYSQPGSKQFEIIKHILEAINHYIHNVPIYIAFTQCDYIAGFVEFFEDLGIEEQKERFGLHFSGMLVQQDFLSQFEEKFDDLIKRLNQKMIWRLHQERQIEKKMLIKHFPLQLLALKDSCRELIKTLSEVAHLNLMGMYFTSSLQKGRPINYLNQEEKNYFPLASQRVRNINSLKAQHKSFFINQLFEQMLKARNTRPKKKIPILHYFIYSLSILVLLGVLIIGYQHYKKGLILAQETHTWLQGLDIKSQDLLKTLNQLNQTRLRLQKKREEQLGGFYLNSLERLYQSIDSTYFKLLTSKFSKQLKQTLEHELNDPNSVAPSQVYRALKVYLMLGNVIARDDAFIKQWFQAHWDSNLAGTPKQYRIDLVKYLDQLLTRKQIISVNQSIIKKTRMQLKELPLHQIAWSILSADILKGYSDSAEDFTLLSLNKRPVPILFEREQVKKIYDKNIPLIYEKLAKGDVTLQESEDETSLIKDVSKNQLEDMVAQTRTYYLTQYHDFWKKLLSINTKDIDLASSDVFKKLGNLAKHLVNMDWTIIRKNTRSIPDFPEFNQLVTPDFGDVNGTFLQWSQLPISEALKNIDAYLSVVMDSHSGAFVAARMRMEDNGEKDPITQLKHSAAELPSPLKEQFTLLAESVWSAVLKQARLYLNQKWQDIVLPFYQEHLKDRYPLFKNAQEEIALEDIGRFFSQEGILTQFFERYIQFFVDQRNFYWEWKKIDGKGLDIAQSTLESFIRGNLIKKMFFSNQNKEPSFRFSMELTALNGRAREGIFQFNDQYINYFGNSNKMKNFTWPGQRPYLASIELLGGQEGKLGHIVKKGPWALFRLLDEAQLETLLDSKRLNIVFDIDHEIMRGLLVVDTEVNPLIQGILNAFRCPEAL